MSTKLETLSARVGVLQSQLADPSLSHKHQSLQQQLNATTKEINATKAAGAEALAQASRSADEKRDTLAAGYGKQSEPAPKIAPEALAAAGVGPSSQNASEAQSVEAAALAPSTDTLAQADNDAALAEALS